MVEDLLQWVETNKSTLSLRCNYVRLTHTEDTKSFPTVSAATLTTFMRMIKSQTHGKGDVLYTGFWAVTNISPSIVLSVFHSSWRVFRLTQTSWRLVWVLITYSLHFGSTLWLQTQIKHFLECLETDLKWIFFFSSKKLFFLSFFLFFFMARSIHHSGLGFKQSNVILNIIRN